MLLNLKNDMSIHSISFIQIDDTTQRNYQLFIHYFKLISNYCVTFWIAIKAWRKSHNMSNPAEFFCLHHHGWFQSCKISIVFHIIKAFYHEIFILQTLYLGGKKCYFQSEGALKQWAKRLLHKFFLFFFVHLRNALASI